jgi:hypothetical protein
MSTNLLAASNPAAEFVGIDFMPVHVANARHVARQGGITNVQFHELSFAEACDKPFEPFDYIVAHGIYSWVPAEARASLVRFLQKNLAAGGMVYLSYNAFPGWTAIAPIRKVVYEYADTLKGGSADRVMAGFKFAATLLDYKAGALLANPEAKQQVERASSQTPNYLAQEFLNDSWFPFYVTDVIREMASAKLTYVASATAAENDLRYLVSEEVAKLIREQPTEELRQLVKDIAINAKFRRDIYTRGGRKLSGTAQREKLGEQYFALSKEGSAMAYNTEHVGRNLSFDTPLARRAVAVMQDGPVRLATVAEALGGMGAKDPLRAVIEIATILMVAGHAMPVSAPNASTRAVNKWLLRHALEDAACNALATQWGSAIQLAPVEMAILSVGSDEYSDPDIVKALQALALRKGRQYNKGGQALTSAGELEQFLLGEIQSFRANRLRPLRALGVQFAGGSAAVEARDSLVP